MHPLAKVFLPLGVLALALVILRRAQRRMDLAPELTRKGLHVVMGGVACTFPWLFHDPLPVAVVAGLSLVPLAALRWIRRFRTTTGALLHGVDRVSYGDLCFPVAVALVFAASDGHPVGYGVPMLLLTVSDPVAAFVGQARGTMLYGSDTPRKSLEGSLAFLVSGFAVTYGALFFAGVAPVRAVLGAFVVSTASGLAEALSKRGLDNLLVPTTSFGALAVSLSLSPSTLAIAATASAALLFAVAASVAAPPAWPRFKYAGAQRAHR